MTDAHDLKTAVAFVQKARARPEKIRVDIKGWVRIKREISALSRVLPTPYSQTARADRWLWREHRALMKVAPINIMGVPVVRVS